MVKLFLVISLLTVFGSLFVAGQIRQDTDPDKQVLEQLQKAGSDLTKPHTIEFFLYFPNEEAANRAAKAVRKTGCKVVVRRGATGSEWLSFATKEMVPKHDELVKLRQNFNEIARKLDGQYDGWGTSIVK